MSPVRPRLRTLTRVGAVAATLALVGLSAPTYAATSTVASASCSSGLVKVDLTKVSEQAELSCANLAGASLSGLSLIQITLDHADLEGADLSNTDLSQAELQGADLKGANLSHTDLTQADLSGADLSGATLTGANTTQATLSGADFTGVKGLTPYSTYILIVALVVFAGLALLTLAKARRRRGPGTIMVGTAPAPSSYPSQVPTQYPAQQYPAQQYPTPGAVAGGYASYSPTPGAPDVPGASYGPVPGAGYAPTPLPGAATPFGALALPGRRGPGASAAIGLLGALIAALGVHMFLGGALNEFSFAFDTLATICQQPTCHAGIDLGFVGLFAGIPIGILGLTIWANA